MLGDRGMGRYPVAQIAVFLCPADDLVTAFQDSLEIYKWIYASDSHLTNRGK